MPVVDASVVVSALVDSGAVGRWAETILAAGGLSAPELLPYEVANVLRRAEASEEITTEMATLAHRSLDRLRVDLYRYSSLAPRAWELRHNLTIYDAAYVALAERLGSDLVTLDARIGRAPGPLCGVRLPPSSS
ncbi:MAG: type II toxin-antitoxin system VapC family toxin [Acidimicrobiales bacterium]